MKRLYLGLDTSNYTTSAALCGDGKIVCSLKLPLPVSEGQRGLRQSDAVFAHIKNIPEIMKRTADAKGSSAIAAVGYSRSPRDGEGSYMPCFLCGEAAAYSAASAAGVPAYGFSHQAGHIAAALYSAGCTELLSREGEFAAFHVSGGTTDILLIHPRGGADFAIERIGGTTDLNAGQLIDRIGVLMGMRFPCGAELERRAAAFEKDGLANIKISVNGLSCALSGAENKAAELWNKSGDASAAAAYTLDFVAKTIDKLTDNLREIYSGIPIIYSGGVMSCLRMRELLGMRGGVYFAEPQYSSDNAAGIALLAYLKDGPAR